ncbi:hypothetical protein K1719_015224 [Acacia pycnantha]|nr:hypothetical protein K1719_015224 [Acacia pycnantha]
MIITRERIGMTHSQACLLLKLAIKLKCQNGRSLIHRTSDFCPYPCVFISRFPAFRQNFLCCQILLRFLGLFQQGLHSFVEHLYFFYGV